MAAKLFKTVRLELVTSLQLKSNERNQLALPEIKYPSNSFPLSRSITMYPRFIIFPSFDKLNGSRENAGLSICKTP